MSIFYNLKFILAKFKGFKTKKTLHISVHKESFVMLILEK